MVKAIVKDKLFRGGFSILGLILILSIWWRLVAPWELNKIVSEPFMPPNIIHPLGTDDLGRDVSVMVANGVLITTFIATFSSLMVSFVGLTVGVISAVWRSYVDAVLMRIVDFLLAIPSLVLALILIAFLGPSIFNVIIILVVIGWPSASRLVRAYTMSLIEMPYVEASRAVGASLIHILVKHVVPGLAPVVIASALVSARAAVLLESGLSFLGLGDPTHISLGTILFYARRSGALASGAYWLIIFPGLLIMLLILAFTLIALSVERNLRVKKVM